MPQLPSLPENAHLADLFGRFGNGIPHLMRYTDAVLRGPGTLTIGEREFVAAYVSGLNACRFCHDSHAIYADLFGIDRDTIRACLDDLDGAPVSGPMRALLGYAKKLNTLPSRLIPPDAEAVLAAGNSEAALYEVIQISALFNMMNRIVEGAGVNFDYGAAPGRHPATGSRPEDHAHSYSDFAARLERAGG